VAQARATVVGAGLVLDFTYTPYCDDVDELPAFRADEGYAALFEVIAPYRSLCRVPVPEGYTKRPAWPSCLFTLPKANIPKAQVWESESIKADQSWLKVEPESVVLPRDGGSMSARKFLEMLPEEVDLSAVRTVLDEGAGVCGLGAELMMRSPRSQVVLSYAPHDTHTNQVQLCLERGVPAIIFSMARYQFPVPPASFDMVTCKWCWHWIGASSVGSWFLEVDRVLREGGYFVMYASVWHSYNFRDQVETWSAHLGWRRIKGTAKDMAIWKKPDVVAMNTGSFLPCPQWEQEQPSFRRFHVPCRHMGPSRAEPMSEHQDMVGLDRDYVQELLTLMPEAQSFTNVLDANSMLGTFGQAIRGALPNAWTLNVQHVKSQEYHHISPNASDGKLKGNYAAMSNYAKSVGRDGLPSVFAEGQVGIYHDWCYMFPAYPRSFDIVHVRHVEVAHSNCFHTAVLEMDRLLRPGGYIVLTGRGLSKKVNPTVAAQLGWVPAQGTEHVVSVAQVYRKMGGTFE